MAIITEHGDHSKSRIVLPFSAIERAQRSEEETHPWCSSVYASLCESIQPLAHCGNAPPFGDIDRTKSSVKAAH